MLLSNLNLLATAPGGVARLRELILTLAVQGKLVPQDSSDEPASELLKKIRAEKDRLIAAGKIKRNKPLVEIAEDEKPFDLPRGWEWVRLNSLLQKIGAGSTPLGGREVYVSSGVKFLRSQNVYDDGLRLNGVAYIKPATHEKMAGTVVVANDLLFNITGASIGRCAVVPSDFDEANVSQHVTIVRTVLPALNAFLHKVLVSRHVQQAVMDVQVGVSREGLSIAKLGQFLIPVPPLAEQSRIVTRVEELMRLCDALEAKGQLAATAHAQLVSTLLATLTDSETPAQLTDNWHRIATHFDLLLDRPEAVDALEQTILQLAVRGLLVPQDQQDEPASVLLKKIRAEKDKLIAQGKIKRDKPLPPIAEDEQPFALPPGWEWARLQQAYDVRDGTHDTPKYQSTGYPLVTSKNIYGGVLDLSDVKLISPADHEQISARSKVDRTDILFAMIGSIGNPVLVNTDVEFSVKNVALFKYYASGLSCPEFLLLVLQTEAAGMKERAAGAVQSFVSLGQLRSGIVALPPLAEQSRIVTRVAQLRRLCADLRQRLTASQSTQAHLAEALVENVA
jgi:type I restriction enzyme S subunit